MYSMLYGHGESVFVSVMHEGSDMAVYCFATDDWLSVCLSAVALAKALCGFDFSGTNH